MFLVAIYISTQIRKRGGVEKDFSHLKCINSVSLETNTSQLEALVDTVEFSISICKRCLCFLSLFSSLIGSQEGENWDLGLLTSYHGFQRKIPFFFFGSSQFWLKIKICITIEIFQKCKYKRLQLQRPLGHMCWSLAHLIKSLGRGCFPSPPREDSACWKMHTQALLETHMWLFHVGEGSIATLQLLRTPYLQNLIHRYFWWVEREHFWFD